MISFVIPAHNEAELIGRTVETLLASARDIGEPCEVIVVDDASTDDTGSLAAERGARVVTVNHRRIAATRNAGAREASGEWLFFVDADTLVPADALRAALLALRGGAIGGGAAVRFDGPVPLYARILERIVLPVVLPLFRLAPGCFLFCARQTHEEVGGFDESLAWAEEVAWARQLKRRGRFVSLREFVITSGRKVRAHSAWSLLWVGIQLALRRRAGLDFWYGPQRGNV